MVHGYPGSSWRLGRGSWLTATLEDSQGPKKWPWLWPQPQPWLERLQDPGWIVTPARKREHRTPGPGVGSRGWEPSRGPSCNPLSWREGGAGPDWLWTETQAPKVGPCTRLWCGPGSSWLQGPRCPQCSCWVPDCHPRDPQDHLHPQVPTTDLGQKTFTTETSQRRWWWGQGRRSPVNPRERRTHKDPGTAEMVGGHVTRVDPSQSLGWKSNPAANI